MNILKALLIGPRLEREARILPALDGHYWSQSGSPHPEEGGEREDLDLDKWRGF